MYRASIWILVGALAALSACSSNGGSSDPCTAADKCSADPAPTAADTAACEATLAGACGSSFDALTACANANRTCTSSNVTDATALQKTCASEEAAYSACCQKNATACQAK